MNLFDKIIIAVEDAEIIEYIKTNYSSRKTFLEELQFIEKQLKNIS